MNLRQAMLLLMVALMVYIWAWVSMNVLLSPLLLMMVYYPVICLGGGYLLHINKGNLTPNYLTQPDNHKECLQLTIRYSIIATVVIWIGYLLIRSALVDPEMLTRGLEICGMYKEGYWITGTLVVLINPVFEELLWRWGIVTLFDSSYGDNGWRGLIITSLMFAGYHPIVAINMFEFKWLILIFILAFIAGLSFVRLYRKSHGLRWVIIYHLIINLNLMFVGYSFAPTKLVS